MLYYGFIMPSLKHNQKFWLLISKIASYLSAQGKLKKKQRSKIFGWQRRKWLTTYVPCLFVLYLPDALRVFVYSPASRALIFDVPPFYLRNFTFLICLHILCVPLFLLIALRFSRTLYLCSFLYMPYVVLFFPLKSQLKEEKMGIDWFFSWSLRE